MGADRNPVIILGAGINGAAIARELALNGFSVWVIDQEDLASGTTSYSSRLIHGGLRYLEHGDWRLVAESLRERGYLLRAAPHLVRPLRFYIPVARRGGGWGRAARGLLGLASSSGGGHAQRGLRLIRSGLRFYDWLAGDRAFPRSSVHVCGDPTAPAVNAAQYRWLCAYSDAQALYPERLVVAQLRDAQRAAEERGADFRVLTYHSAELVRDRLLVRSRRAGGSSYETPVAAIVNATGAWVDATLRRLSLSHPRLSHPRLIGGTKGSHLLTSQPKLLAALRGAAVYAEAADGRPVFLLPFGESTLIGTTDIPFEGDPATARAEPSEIDYLLRVTNEVFPQVNLVRAEIESHYCGVRPLPFVGPKSPAAITRHAQLIVHAEQTPPVLSVVGGKLTTCRALGEDAATLVGRLLQRPCRVNSRHRPLDGHPPGQRADESELNAIGRIANQTGFPEAQVEACWRLCGEETSRLLTGCGQAADRTLLAGTPLPRGFVRQLLAQEWVRALDDVVERRLMLVFQPRLALGTLRELAELMAERPDRPEVAAADTAQEVAACAARLADRYGKQCE